MQFDRGVTFIEILVVIAIFISAATQVVPYSFAAYRAALARSDQSLLNTALRHARAESLNGMCRHPGCTRSAAHGVSIHDGRFTMFEGDSYAARERSSDEVIETQGSVLSGDAQIIFQADSGDAVDGAVIVLVESGGRISTTSVGSYGEITRGT